MKRIAIFASGSGTNAQNIVEYFRNNKRVRVEMILSNSANAGVHERAERLNVPSIVFNKRQLYDNDSVCKMLVNKKIDLIVLAGFLWLVPSCIIKSFPKRIINIHPALLPKYGGKGMYGMNVHKAVIKNQERMSGITIHFVNEEYDKGDIIFQERCDIELYNTPELLAQKIHSLEYENFPKVIDKVLSKL
jgi:phosphoribosylglycinamide formyltransferase 1